MAEAGTGGRFMSDPTREEIDAKLATVEARTETRFTDLSGKIDRLADSIAVLGSTIRIELESVKSEIANVKSDIANVKSDVANVKSDVANVKSDVAGLKSDVVDLRSDNKYTRWTIVVTVVASALAAIAALWITQANLLAAFSAGIAVRTETREPPPAPPSGSALRPDAH
jgi:phage-related protein